MIEDIVVIRRKTMMMGENRLTRRDVLQSTKNNDVCEYLYVASNDERRNKPHESYIITNKQ
jgi:hypothetical protein